MNQITILGKPGPLLENRSCQISVITNITLEPYFAQCIKSIFLKSDILVNLQIIRFENYLSETNEIFNSDFVVVLLNFECQYPNWYNDILSEAKTLEQLRLHVVEKCKKVYEGIKSGTYCPILWFGFENEDFHRTNICGSTSTIASVIDLINMDIGSFLDENDSYINMKHLIADVGISNAFDNKGKYRWNAPYSQQMIKILSNEIYKQYLIQNGITPKCLVLDCDGVLWGGILSEDKIEQIKLGNEGLGRPYQDFQRFLLTLYHHGVILAICSKNDLQDVLQVFREHSGMILKEQHIACFQVNWDNKPGNIRKIAEKLNIGLDSIVFVDDSKFEVESVHTFLPDVHAIQYNSDSIYKDLACFNLKSRTNLEKVTNRILTYQTNTQRENLRAESIDFDSYLEALEIKIDIHRAISSEYNRIAELTQRTNQCTNGTRYTVTELSECVRNPNYKLYSVYVSDKFSDLGLVGTVGIDGSTLDLFSLSCRALGRNVEENMLKVIMNENVKDCIFVSTGKNETIGKTFSFMNKFN